MADQSHGERNEMGEPRGPWRKSSFSDGQGDCVEVAPAGGGVLVRNSNDPTGQTVHFTHAELHAFLLGAKDGEFDDLTTDSA